MSFVIFHTIDTKKRLIPVLIGVDQIRSCEPRLDYTPEGSLLSTSDGDSHHLVESFDDVVEALLTIRDVWFTDEEDEDEEN